ncbi:hypothetical protein DAI22_08g159750 [Oryza sativa Japonica Group]|nr:hypothetical protein DAI22_08g159750 [Oryza sativa Japonica Group]
MMQWQLGWTVCIYPAKEALWGPPEGSGFFFPLILTV